MKYCEEYAALLDLFVDGELPAEEMKRVEDHLTECPGCRAYVDDALALRAAFPDAEDTVVPEGFAQGVMERVRAAAARERESAERKRRSFRRWMGTAAALAACCALVILVRTGPAGDDAAPAGGDNAVLYQDHVAADAAESAEAVQRMAPEEPQAPADAPAEEAKKENRAADTGGIESYSGDQAPASVAPAALAPEAAQYQAAGEAALYLTEEEAGDLLDGFSAVWENGVEWRYELNGEEYRALLEALGRSEELPEAAEGPFLVVVTGPAE